MTLEKILKEELIGFVVCMEIFHILICVRTLSWPFCTKIPWSLANLLHGTLVLAF